MRARVARVEVVESDAQALAAVQVVDEGGVGLRGLVRLGLREVHEVGAVRQDVLGCGVGVGFAVGVELVTVAVLQGRVVPFALRLEEEGEGVAAYVQAVGDAVVDALGEESVVWEKVVREWRRGRNEPPAPLTCAPTNILMPCVRAARGSISAAFSSLVLRFCFGGFLTSASDSCSFSSLTASLTVFAFFCPLPEGFVVLTLTSSISSTMAGSCAFFVSFTFRVDLTSVRDFFGAAISTFSMCASTSVYAAESSYLTSALVLVDLLGVADVAFVPASSAIRVFFEDLGDSGVCAAFRLGIAGITVAAESNVPFTR